MSSPFGVDYMKGMCRCGRPLVDQSDEPDPYCPGCGLVKDECDCGIPNPILAHVERKLEEDQP
jgi:hypothetical protein